VVGGRKDYDNKKSFGKGYTMCGIAGWVSYDRDLKSQQDVITTMTKRWRVAVRMRAASGSIGMSD